MNLWLHLGGGWGLHVEGIVGGGGVHGAVVGGREHLHSMHSMWFPLVSLWDKHAPWEQKILHGSILPW